MKRFAAMILTLVMALALIPAHAAGSIETTEDTWYVVSHSDNYRVYYYATVTNTSEKPVVINDLLFEIQSLDGTTVESTSKYKLYPEVLTAGQTGYLVLSKDVKDLKDRSEIDHYSLTITTKVEEDKVTHPLDATALYIPKDEDDNEDVLRATVTNTLTDIAFDVNVAMAMRDAAGKLLYIVGDNTKDIGLNPGDVLLLRSLVKSDIMDELEDNFIAVSSVEAIAYTVEDLDD